MRVHVTWSTFGIHQDEIVVAVDVLRSSSTIANALRNGAHAVVPFTSIADAIRFRETKGRDNVVLAGERNGITPKGFNYNVSPFDMTRDNIGSLKIGYTSTNLTRVIGKLRKSRVLIGGVVNAKVTADYLKARDRNVTIVACGTREGPTVEDIAGAGAIASSLIDEELSDEVLAAIGLFEAANLQKLIRRGRIARKLISLGYERDIEFCLSLDSTPVVAGLVGNEIVDLRKKLASCSFEQRGA